MSEGVRRIDPIALAARAAYVLRGNSGEGMTRAAPHLYPHQWSWDAAFVAVGLAHLDAPRACEELDGLFAGQWRNGMLPHIVFDANETGYFPGPERWACAEHTSAAPSSPRTSGICQPPVHALAVHRIATIAAHRGREADEAVTRWLPGAYQRMLSWHRYLATHRDPKGEGLLTIYHGWESGMDNSPRWDEPYANVEVQQALPAYLRRDVDVVTDASQRPSDTEYDRYLWLVEELKEAGYDDERIRTSASFLVADVFMSAVFAASNEALADLGARIGAPDVAELESYAERFRAGVASSVNPETGLATDTDLRTGRQLRSETIAGFSPLLCGALDEAAERRMLSLLTSPQWSGHLALRHPVLPTTRPESPDFRPRQYWRGPSWPVINWLFAWTLDRRGVHQVSQLLRRAAIAELREGSLGEYYEPMTGEALGSRDQSWTAAAALDLLLAQDWVE